MTKAIEQQLIENISLILKRSLTADATLADLREHNKAGFEAIFKKDPAFNVLQIHFNPMWKKLLMIY
ncbi:hypothetical protein L3081_17925 [Colwellia sp. MSW7]|uniref:Uncharacterized protein n=1 Tax=Colwellia maritima TaxID=2912588 RepID=A0ABS9X406_9GAMM|nr:hypothetical protein [Colwellia maritima]MCI2284926.1 hypothetical protein [Colwellia maritima]